jgi:RNA polymerase sigma factor (sigma-70 family)
MSRFGRLFYLFNNDCLLMLLHQSSVLNAAYMVNFSSEDTVSTETALLSSLRQGDNKALEHLYREYGPMIFRFVWLNQGSRQEAEDLLQDGIVILLDILRKKDFRLRHRLKTFFYSICRNQWLKRWRVKKRFLIQDSEAYLEQLPEMAEEEPELPDDQEVYQEVKNLQDPCYTLLVGYYYQKMNLEQLAQVLNYSTANVAKQRKFRCIERLKKKFL